MALALVLVPIAFALLALAIPSNRVRPLCVSIGGAAHLALALIALSLPRVTGLDGWLLLDGIGRLVLALTSVLFFLCSLYARGYLAFHLDRSNRVFCACLLGFIGLLTLVLESQHLGLMWVGMETTTLVSAPMMNFNRD